MGDLWKYKAIREIKARQEEARKKMKDENFAINYECRSCGTLIKDFNSLLVHIDNGQEHEIRYLNKDETS